MVRRSQVREVVHDMRQPLAVIAALVGSAEVRDDLPPDVRTCLDQIKGQVRNLTELCQRVLDPGGPLRVLAVDELVAEVVRDAELAHDRPIGLATGEATVLGDDVGLRRAVWNLLENACRAAGPRWVRVAVAQVDGEVRVDVNDGGPGFTNGPPGTSSLGLAIVESVVQRHGGRAEVEVSELRGTTVTLVMPAVDRRLAVNGSTPAAQEPQMARVRKRKTGEWCPAS
jgi:signal transduction histidine kinase